MLTEAQEQQLYDAIYGGRNIEATKLYRDFTGAGLKDAKDFVYALVVDLRTESPERFVSPASRGGCAGKLVLMAAIGVVGGSLLLVRTS